MTQPTLNSLNLIVGDMEASLAFYRELGVDVPEDVWRTASGGHHVEIDMPGGLGLDLDSEALAAEYNAGWGPAAPRCLVGFSVASRDAVDERYSALTGAGYEGVQAPYDTFWGARYAIVADPDGNHVGLMSPRDPARGSAPPDI